MRNINLLFILLLLLSSCSFKHEADSRLNSYVASVIPDPNFSIEDKRVEWDDDSVCIIDFRLRARNAFGGYAMENCEYILVREGEFVYEALISTDDNTPILRRYSSVGYNTGIGDEYNKSVYKTALRVASKKGRIVEK